MTVGKMIRSREGKNNREAIKRRWEGKVGKTGQQLEGQRKQRKNEHQNRDEKRTEGRNVFRKDVKK